ncbi:MAG: ferrous iron transporter B [Blastocatellia bacterium]
MGSVALSNEKNSSEKKDLTVCLVGMPNAGKTTLMNALTGGSFHTANYPGVTVTLSEGKSKAAFGEVLKIVDLPGVHSPFSPSQEEELSCQVLTGKHPLVKPDAFVLVIDASQMERHLKFAGFAARQQKPMIIAITMVDLLTRLEQSLDIEKLAKSLKVPVIAVDGRTGEGAAELVKTLHQVINKPVLENPLQSLSDEPIAAYNAIRKILVDNEVITKKNPKALRLQDSLTSRFDQVVLNKYLGFPIFFIILSLLFASIFWLAQPFMDGIDNGFKWLSDQTTLVLGDNIATKFLAEGLIQGVGAVAVFFPQIIILFFLMTLLEDSGYLARGAALVDRPLSALGLHGRSFVPMLSGFACAIPAVFATRAIPTKRERLLTIWILPLMSCSARLPVYALLLAALFPADSSWQAGLVLAGIYFASLLLSALIAGLVGRLAYRRRSLSMLAMELPAYRIPQWKPIFFLTWSRSSSYLKKAGTPIVIISAILWLLSNFGLGSQQPVDNLANANSKPALIVKSELDNSFAAQLGKVMEPVLQPMGVDWRVGVGLISAFAAREVFVSTMAIVFHVPGEDQETQQQGLLEQMRSATFSASNKPIFTTATIIGLIIYFFFSLQCISTVAIVRKETNSWKIALVQLAFYTAIGYILAVLTVQGLQSIGVA